MEEKQTRETLLARTRVWKWPLGEGRELQPYFSLSDLTSRFPMNQVSVPAGRPGLAEDLQLPAWVRKGETQFRDLGFLCPNRLCRAASEGLWVL